MMSMSADNEVISALPDSWRRWNGARPEVTGAPANSIIALPGLEKLGVDGRTALLQAAATLGIPVDALALVMYSESRFDTKALNPLPAAGLTQLTVQANLPGYTTKEAVQAITGMDAADQINLVVVPFYQRIPNAAGADPGFLYMKNFLPALAGLSEETVLGQKDSEELLGHGSSLKLGVIYKANPGFDAQKRGYFTIGDAYATLERAALKANGQRMAVDGTTIAPPVTSFPDNGAVPMKAAGGPVDDPSYDRVIYAHPTGPQLCRVDQQGNLFADGDPGPCGALLVGHVYGLGPGGLVDLGNVGTDANGRATLTARAIKTAAGCGILGGCKRSKLTYTGDMFAGAKTAGGEWGHDPNVGDHNLSYPVQSAPWGQNGNAWGDAGFDAPPLEVQIVQPAPDEPMPMFDTMGYGMMLPQQSCPPPARKRIDGGQMVQLQSEPDLGFYSGFRAQGPGGFPVGETTAPRYAPVRRASGPSQADIVKKGIWQAFQDNQIDPYDWTNINVNGYTIVVMNEPLAVGGLRLPTSFMEQLEIAKALNALPVTKAISDARWAQAKQVLAQPIADPRGAVLNDPGQVIEYNKRIGPNTGEFRDGFWKESVLVAGLAPSGRGAMAQYGFRKAGGGTFQGGLPGDHDERWKDYSNTPTYVGRQATFNGQTVDLLDVIANGGPLGGPIPQWLVNKLRGTGEAGA